ncbi:MAG: oxygenase MpaB family protein [Mucilaginibacter sp.]
MAGQNQYSYDFLAAKRQLGDTAADLFINRIFETTTGKIGLHDWLTGVNYNKQLSNLPVVYASEPFIANACILPHWANTKLMDTGSAFFARHAETIMTLLGLLSLPYCYTAANGAMVLYLSDRMRNDTTKRLRETAEFVWEVMAPGAFNEEGKAFAAILKVRLMHAAVRYYTLSSARWDMSWGLPINQEDMAGTNLSFSLIIIRGLRKLGFSVNEEDQHGFMLLWNVIGYLSGLDEDLLPANAKHAQLLDSRIGTRQFKVSDHGRELSRSLTEHIKAINTGKASADEVLGLMRYLLGYDIADMLGITAPELPAYKLSIIKTINLLKGLKPAGNLTNAYKEAYYRFKQQQLVTS